MAFRRFNEYVACKAREQDVTAVRVDPQNTSKRCSMCGFTSLGCGIGVERILDSLHPARKTKYGSQARLERHRTFSALTFDGVDQLRRSH
ncbi:zinc ribbon domain-containing protein [Haloarcula sp. CBA1130]|uniref:zinc ribbon domain-containing protein n=1 Tax=Haloarcula sp. CBA1130 TaxID=1853685 RepID=UPI00351ACEB1